MNPKTLEAQNNFLNSANDSNIIFKYFLNSEDKTVLPSSPEPTVQPQTEPESKKEINPLEKVQKFFRKNIKLRNATIKKNYWGRNYISNTSILLKISELIPIIQSSQGVLLCINNYVHNDNYQEYLCAIQSETDFSSSTFVEKYIAIDNSNNNEDNNNILMNPKKIYDKPLIKQNIYKLVENVYKKIKRLKNELSSSKENFVNNFITIQRVDNPFEENNMNSDLKCKLYTIFPNINFELKQIKNLSLSSICKLNKLLVSRKKGNLQNKEGKIISNGFVTMSNEKRIISLYDDMQDLQQSKAAKTIIFGIWISLKNEDVTMYKSENEIVTKNKYIIYRKCFDFLNMSSKIETIYSPSPDEGVFLLILFMKGAHYFYEVKVIPNEVEQCIENSNNELEINFDNFSNQWLVMKRKFKLKNEIGFEIDNTYLKVDTVANIVNTLNGIVSNKSQNSSSKQQQYIKSVGSGNKNKFISSGNTLNLGINIQNKANPSPPGFDPMPELFEESAGNEFFNNLKSSLPINTNGSNTNTQMSVNNIKGDTIQPEPPVTQQIMIMNNNINSLNKYHKSKSGENTNNIQINNNNNILNEEYTERNNEFVYDYPFVNSKPPMITIPNVYQNKQSLPIDINKTPISPFSQSISNYPNNISRQQSASSLSHKKVLSLTNLNNQEHNIFPNQNIVTSSTPNNQLNTNIQFPPSVSKCEEGAQTELSSDQIENNSINNSQIQNLNMIIAEQSHSIQALQQKVSELELLLNNVTNILKERENTCICKRATQATSPVDHHNDMIENDLVSDDDIDDKLSESLQKSKSDSNEQRIHLSKDISTNTVNNNNNHSSILNVSDSNANEKSIPRIIYNSTLLSNNVNESENY